MNLGEKLLRWREEEGFTQTDAASYFGVSTKSYQFWEYGRTEPRPNKIRQIREAIDDLPQVTVATDGSIKYLAHINGRWVAENADQAYSDIVRQFCTDKSANCILAIMKGDNMFPGLIDGDLIVAVQQDRIDRDARYILLSNDRKVMKVKRCQIRGDVVIAYSDNPLYPEITITEEDDVHVVGRLLYPNDGVPSRH